MAITFSKALMKRVVKLRSKGTSVAKTAQYCGISERSVYRICAEAKKTSVVKEAKKTVKKVDKLIKKIDDKISTTPPVWQMTSMNIIITSEGNTSIFDSSHQSFKEAQALILDGKVETALELLNTKARIEKFCKGLVDITDGVLTYDGLELKGGIVSRIFDRMESGEDFEYLVNFLNNMMLNPSNRAVNELFGFLEHNDITITEDGYFIAYKRVRDDYKDMYTGKMDNSVGSIVKMPRNQVNENSQDTCSSGLHVAAKSYIPYYGGGTGRILECKVHPMNVVSVPVDYANAKMRVCEYHVSADITEGFDGY